MSIPMVDLRPMLAATEPAWRANLERLFERMQFILGEQVDAFERELAAATPEPRTNIAAQLHEFALRLRRRGLVMLFSDPSVLYI